MNIMTGQELLAQKAYSLLIEILLANRSQIQKVTGILRSVQSTAMEVQRRAIMIL